MNKVIYWIIAAFFVFVSTLVSIFIAPYLDACTGNYYTKVIVLDFGIAILISTIILYFKNKKSKLPAMILFPISLTIILSSAIHFLRFPSELHLVDNYIKSGPYIDGAGKLYSKLGFEICDYKGDYIGIGYDCYGNKMIISSSVREEYDDDYRIYNVKIYFYDEDGNYIDQSELEYSWHIDDVPDYYDRRKLFKNDIKERIKDCGIDLL